MNGQGITLYADASASDTAGGNDSLSINGPSSTVYGVAGGDTLILSGGTTNRFDLGNRH